MIELEPLAANFCYVRIEGKITVWFSYKTPVAFSMPNGDLVIRQNDWGQTTGKHLNMLDKHQRYARIPGVEFESLLEKELSK